MRFILLFALSFMCGPTYAQIKPDAGLLQQGIERERTLNPPRTLSPERRLDPVAIKPLTGTGNGNYTLTQQGNDTGKSITAKETTTSTPVPPSLLQIQSNTPSATQLPPAVLLATAPNREGIFVSLIRQPSVNVKGAAFVSLPKDTVAMREGFSFPLPTKIAEKISDQSTLQITTLERAPLPSWLHYDVDTKIFTVDAVPNGVLPMQVLITIDQQQTSIVIYERAN